MKIELWYDFVYRETRVCIDGSWQEESDMYSFLYPVRKYPLQSWLLPVGSWTGIVRQLEDMARGEKIELEFHGRRLDFDDLLLTVKAMDNIEIIFVEWDVISKYNDRINALTENMKKLQAQMPVDDCLVKAVAQLTDKNALDGVWLAVANSKEEIWRIQKEEKLCCVVDCDIFASFEEFETVGQLTRSMHRPSDAICCCFSDAAGMEIYEKYASEFPNLNFVFTLSSDRTWRERLWEKYGHADQTVWQLKAGLVLCGEILDYLGVQKEKNDDMRMELVQKNTEVGGCDDIERELEYCNEKASRIYDWQKTWQKLKDSMTEHLTLRLG